MSFLIPNQRSVFTSNSPPSTPRLQLGPRPGPTLLDGGWWPRSRDPIAEIPGLALAAADVVHGRVTRIALGAAGWSQRVRKLSVDNRIVRVGFFDTQDPQLAILSYGDRTRVDLLVVPPDTDPHLAVAAMAQAADPGNHIHAPGIIVTLSARIGPALEPTPALDAWDSEGGRAEAPARPTR